MRHGDFDPLASLQDLTYWEICNLGFDLDCGSPLQNLSFALREESYFGDVRSRIICIYSNTIQIEMSASDASQQIEYLCTKYELARRR